MKSNPLISYDIRIYDQFRNLQALITANQQCDVERWSCTLQMSHLIIFWNSRVEKRSICDPFPNGVGGPLATCDVMRPHMPHDDA